MPAQRSPGEIEVRTFGPGLERDVIELVSTYTRGWPYSRPIDGSVVAHWRTMDGRFQPEHMLVAYRHGVPRAFLHGEWTKDWFDVHILAVAPGAVSEAVHLLREIEPVAEAAGSPRIVGPTHRAWPFYNGYVLGHEPVHPHWERDATEAFVRSGWFVSYASLMLVADLSRKIEVGPFPEGYAACEGSAKPEFAARVFHFGAVFGGTEVAGCTGRLLEDLLSPSGGSVGQLGFVGTEAPHRRLGLARRLVQLSLIRLREWGASECLIVTGHDNLPALRAYENAGFERRYSLNQWSKDFGQAEWSSSG